MEVWAVEDNTCLQIPALVLRSYWALKRCETLQKLSVLICRRESRVLSVPGGYFTHIEWMKPPAQHRLEAVSHQRRAKLPSEVGFLFSHPQIYLPIFLFIFPRKAFRSSLVWIPLSFPQVHSVISHQCRLTPTQSLLFLMAPHTFILWYCLSTHSGSQWILFSLQDVRQEGCS